MSEQFPRRGFLRSLVSLPMLGGGVALIGTPHAVAEPITTGLMQSYRRFLTTELNLLAKNCHGEGLHTSAQSRTSATSSLISDGVGRRLPRMTRGRRLSRRVAPKRERCPSSMRGHRPAPHSS